MKVIIIGAGRGSRLRPLTDDRPKCMLPVDGRPILQWILDAFAHHGLDDVVFVGGYRMESVQDYAPDLRFVYNDQWPHNNILASLFYAEEFMGEGFFCSYADTIITPALLAPFFDEPSDITLSLDTTSNERYSLRPPQAHAPIEGTYVDGPRVTQIERVIGTSDAYGEFTGVTRFSAAGAQMFRDKYHSAKERYTGQAFQLSPSFETCYLIDMYREMLDADIPIGHAASRYSYLEIDTPEDYALAQKEWVHKLQK